MAALNVLPRQLVGLDARSTLSLAERSLAASFHTLVARVNVPYNASIAPQGLTDALNIDPWKKSGKYGLVWLFFGLALLVSTASLHFYHAVTDRIRTAIHEDEQMNSSTSSPSTEYEMSALKSGKSSQIFFPPPTGKSSQAFFPPPPNELELEKARGKEVEYWSFRPILFLVAFFRFFFYRPAPEIALRKGWRPIVLPTFSTLTVAFLGVVMSLLYCFLPQPLFWQSIQYGSPPLAIRSGMMAVALVPWVVATAMKTNIITVMTGIGHQRLNVLHRWGAYLCLLLAIVHTVPFYLQKGWDPAGYAVYQTYFNTNGLYIFGTGIAALAPLGFLVVHSLPVLRRAAYELFVKLHVPVSIVFMVMLFWHTKNALATWDYLYATVAVWATSWIVRPFFFNWTKPGRVSWLVGDDATVTLLPENAVKVTISTQVKWKPGQYVYLRMPGVAAMESHPFTIASLCSDDLPSEYGEGFRDMILVLRPFGGFTKRLAETAVAKGPYHVYRAFVDGPYGGMKRRLESFDSVVLIAGGSGITALVSQLLDLIKRMRDGKAITRNVRVVWALRRPETLEWFKEELRICRECAPPEAVRCQFFITAAKRWAPRDMRMSARTGLTQDHKRLSMYLHDGINDAFQSIADRRTSYVSHRASARSYDEAAAAELKRQFDVGDDDGADGNSADALAALTAPPRAHMSTSTSGPVRNFSKPMSAAAQAAADAEDAAAAAAAAAGTNLSSMSPAEARQSFGFASTPTEFRKNIMRFAFLPAAQRGAPDGWSTEYGRPDLTYMLREMATGGSSGGGEGGTGAGLGGCLGRRTAVFVCGPPSMRVTVSRAVAALQTQVLKGRVEEVFLHTENYAL